MAPPAPQVLPLENGDHLEADEFLRRYEAMPPSTRAELVEGVVFMSSAVRADAHGRPHGLLTAWLFRYERATPGLRAYSDTTLRFSRTSVVQPDLALRIDPERGGQCVVGEDGYLVGPPELVVEIAASSASRDLHSKKDLYCAQGVQEYLVWRTLDGCIDWFVNRDGAFQPLPPDRDGCLHCELFPGLVLDATALLAGNDDQVHERLERALDSDAHAAIVERLGRAGT